MHLPYPLCTNQLLTNPPPPMSRRCSETGRAGLELHAGAFKRSVRIRLAAGADLLREKLDTFQRDHEIERVYEDYKTLLAEVKPDLVSIATHVGLHRQMLEDCARARRERYFSARPPFFEFAAADWAALKATGGRGQA